MNNRQLLRVFIIVLAALALGSVTAAQEGPATVGPLSPVSPPWWNLMQNSSYESGSTNPDSWSTYSALPGALFTWDPAVAVDGTKSVRIVQSSPNDACWLQAVAVDPNTEYVLSGWIKTQGVAHTSQSVDAGANLSVPGTSARTPALVGTHEWRYVSVVFNSGPMPTPLVICARLGYPDGATTGTAWFDNVQLAPVKRLYLTSSQDGKVGGVSFTRSDVLVHNPALNTWAMYFDGSDVGITRNVDCIEVLWTGAIIMSLQAAQDVPGLGLVKPQDLIFFAPTSTGADTAGTFYWTLIGSGVGLDTAAENIDACAGVAYYVISTAGQNDIFPDGRDEDLFAYGNGGDYWSLRLDGSTVPNLEREDVWGHSWGLNNTSDIYLSTRDTYAPGNGAHFTNKQIFVVHEPWPELFWDGPAHGFRFVIDGFSIER